MPLPQSEIDLNLYRFVSLKATLTVIHVYIHVNAPLLFQLCAHSSWLGSAWSTEDSVYISCSVAVLYTLGIYDSRSWDTFFTILYLLCYWWLNLLTGIDWSALGKLSNSNIWYGFTFTFQGCKQVEVEWAYFGSLFTAVYSFQSTLAHRCRAHLSNIFTTWR